MMNTRIQNVSKEDILEYCNEHFGEFAYIWIDCAHAQYCGIYKSGNCTYDRSFSDEDLMTLQSMRVFDSQKEFGVFETMNGYASRLLEARSAEDEVIHHHILTGTQSQPCERKEFVRLTEERGTEVTIPFINGIDTIDEQVCRAAVIVHYHMSFDEYGMGHFSDCRFSGFTLEWKQ